MLVARCQRPATLLLVSLVACVARATPVDLAGYNAACGIEIQERDERLFAQWTSGDGDRAALTLDLRCDQPLIESLTLAHGADAKPRSLVAASDLALLLTVGQRNLNGKGGWTIFFDNPRSRPHETYRAAFHKSAVRVTSDERRATIIVERLSAGPFNGDLRLTMYAGLNLLRCEAVVSTGEDARAIVYDLGLVTADPKWKALVWVDNQDRPQRQALDPRLPGESLQVRNRAIAVEAEGGSLAIFPPPHQFFYPMDSTDNFGLVWRGRAWRSLAPEYGVGVCQPREGDRRYVPWINAPPGTQQHLSAFCLLSPSSAEQCLAEARRYTRGDRFAELPGYQTFSSHYHIEHTLDYQRRAKGQTTNGVPAELERPGFVDAFKAAGVKIVHLAEFHVERSEEFFANRLASLQLLDRECRRLSDENLLLLPGEEPNFHLGGHWISLFPRQVYWIPRSAAGEPFVEDIPPYGKVYRVGSTADMLRLMQEENGLMWTAHPRIKASLGFPDEYRERDFYLSDRFLGATWKAMPADLSQPRLGVRSLDLMNDMANWGQRKYVLGEVDVFKIRPEHELYGHMNVNYLRLDRLPRYADGWQSVLDALRAGHFFVTTGEVLIPEFSVDGKHSGDTLKPAPGEPSEVIVDLQWTFPLAFLEIVSGDGVHVGRQRVELSDTDAFGQRRIRVPAKLAGRKWVRLEVWDIAANGAFTQPVWLE